MADVLVWISSSKGRKRNCEAQVPIPMENISSRNPPEIPWILSFRTGLKIYFPSQINILIFFEKNNFFKKIKK
jgi:hypothetical protein